MAITIETLLAILSPVLLAMTTAIAALWRQSVVQNKEHITMLNSRVASLESILDASLFANDKLLSTKLVQEGNQPITSIAPVVPEHSSPITPAQAATAKIATYRARVVAIYLAAGLPAAEVFEMDKKMVGSKANKKDK